MTRLPDAAPPLTDARLLLWPLLAMTVLWTILPVLVHSAPPLDMVEGALWGREWVVGTYKHPAMPAWFIEAGRYLNGGAVGWPAYLASQLFNLATLVLTFLFARDVAGARVATAAVLSLLGVEYFSWRSSEFNHTIAQMPFWIGAVWCAWRAIDRGHLLWWLALGIMAAAGLYAKLSNAMLLIVIAGWLLATPRGRATLATPGPWLAAVVFAVLCAPVVRWLVSSGYQPLEYASARGREQTLSAMLLFPFNTLLQAAPIPLALAAAGLFDRRRVPAPPSPYNAAGIQFLLIMAVAPPLLSVILAIVGRSGLRASWLAPALPLLAVLLIARLDSRLTERVMTRLGHIGLAVAVAVPLVYALLVPRAGGFSSAPPLRVNWPQAEMARRLSDAWTSETGKPLKIVAGSSWAAGLVGLDHPDRPSILTEGIMAFSPWISPQRLQREGALLVWTEGRGSIPTPVLLTMVNGRKIKETRVPYPHSKPGHELVVKYVVIKPE